MRFINLIAVVAAIAGTGVTSAPLGQNVCTCQGQTPTEKEVADGPGSLFFNARSRGRQDEAPRTRKSHTPATTETPKHQHQQVPPTTPQTPFCNQPLQHSTRKHRTNNPPVRPSSTPQQNSPPPRAQAQPSCTTARSSFPTRPAAAASTKDSATPSARAGNSSTPASSAPASTGGSTIVVGTWGQT
ncbi:hypothetical protein LTR50_001146 [Elasticomyces elasticus]|nr:hypothetical protein LTR50_001146 [Elasticomyces elasticus]